jgi:hypothetical protein
MGLKTWYNGFGPRIRNESWVWLKAALDAGTIPPPSRCSACGESRGQIDYHTEDYSRPFGPHIYAHELCFRCHMCIHARFRNPAMFRRYTEMLEAGAVYEPLMNRREIGKVWAPGWVESPVAVGPPRATLEFFRSLTMGKGDRVGPEAAEGRPGARQARMFDDI